MVHPHLIVADRFNHQSALLQRGMTGSTLITTRSRGITMSAEYPPRPMILRRSRGKVRRYTIAFALMALTEPSWTKEDLNEQDHVVAQLKERGNPWD